MDTNLLVRFNIWTLGKPNAKITMTKFYNFDIACVKKLHKEATDNKIKWRDLRFKKWTSFNNTGIHFNLVKCNVTSSDASRPTSLNIALI